MKKPEAYTIILQLQATVDQLKEARDKLVQSEKMASIGLMAAGVAHEINNPIGFSLSNMKMLEEYLQSILKLDAIVVESLPQLSDSPMAKEYQDTREQEDIDFVVGDLKELLADTIKGLNRVSSIVSNLKKVSRVGNLEKEPCNINDVIIESLKVVWAELKYNMKVKKSFAELPTVHCHCGEIYQVLMNMFLNASHACNKEGVLIIKTQQKQVDGKSWVVIEITDNGKGMTREVRKKVFDPFFTTKPVGVGTGLGLSVSFGIIEQHGGKIVVESKVDKGARFSIYLPENST